MFIVFIVWMLLGAYLINTAHEQAEVVMGLGVLYMSLIFCLALFIIAIETESTRNIF